jgi:hypothetical protein
MYNVPKSIVIGLLLGVIPTQVVKPQESTKELSYEDFYKQFIEKDYKDLGMEIPPDV